MQMINVDIGILTETNACVSPGSDWGAGRISSGNSPQGMESLGPGSSRPRGTTPGSEIQPRCGSLSCTRFPHGETLPSKSERPCPLPAPQENQVNRTGSAPSVRSRKSLSHCVWQAGVRGKKRLRLSGGLPPGVFCPSRRAFLAKPRRCGQWFP